MNEIMNKLLLAGDIFVPKMHLKQPGFTYSPCGPLTKKKKKKKKKKELKSLCKLEILILFTKMSLMRLLLNTIWLMEIKRFSIKNSIRQNFNR